MGIFDIFKKKEIATIEDKHEIREETVNLEDISDLVQGMIEEEINKSKKEIEKLEKNISSEIIKLKENSQKMSDSYFEKTDQAYTRINAVKDGWLRKFMASLDTPKKIGTVDAENIRVYIEKNQNILNIANTNNLRENFILSNYFKKEMKNIVTGLSKIDESVRTLNGFIDEKSTLKIQSELNKKISDFAKDKKRRDELSSSIEKMKKESVHLSEMKIEREKNLKDIKSGSDMTRLLSLEKSISIDERKVAELKIHLSEDLSIMNRPLKKIKHEADKNESRIIGEFLESPVDYCMSEGGEKKVENIINIVSSYDNLGLAEKDAKKIDSFASKIKNGKIKEIKTNYESTISSVNNMKSEVRSLEKIRNRRESVENDIRLMDNEVEKIQKDLERTKSDIENIETNLADSKEDIVKYILENLRVKYTIKE